MRDLANRLGSQGKGLGDLRCGNPAGKLLKRKSAQDDTDLLNARSQQLADLSKVL